jgi:hypothetical protein
LPQPPQHTFYAVATLENLGTPYANTLTRKGGASAVSLDLLSAAVFAPPETGANPSTWLPALKVCEPQSDGLVTSIPGTCPGARHLSLSAVVLLAADPLIASSYSAASRQITATRTSDKGLLLRWLSYERLMWLYLKAGLLSLP